MLIGSSQVIKLTRSSPLGYERKHEALCGMKCYGEAIDAFETILSKMSQSSDPVIHGENDDIVLMFIH